MPSCAPGTDSALSAYQPYIYRLSLVGPYVVMEPCRESVSEEEVVYKTSSGASISTFDIVGKNRRLDHSPIFSSTGIVVFTPTLAVTVACGRLLPTMFSWTVPVPEWMATSILRKYYKMSDIVETSKYGMRRYIGALFAPEKLFSEIELPRCVDIPTAGVRLCAPKGYVVTAVASAQSREAVEHNLLHYPGPVPDVLAQKLGTLLASARVTELR